MSTWDSITKRQQYAAIDAVIDAHAEGADMSAAIERLANLAQHDRRAINREAKRNQSERARALAIGTA